MKLSEAIRLGATMKPQGFGSFDHNGHTCAIGAACDAIGERAELFHYLKTWEDIFKILDFAPCLECGNITTHLAWRKVQNIVVHLNDRHRWSRERIADYVEIEEMSMEQKRLPQVEAIEVAR